MNSEQTNHRLRARADRADVAVLRTALGASVELMRTSYSKQAFPRHTHDYFTLGLMLRGSGTLWYGGVFHTTYPGDVIVIPPGEVHTGGVGRGDGLSYLAVHLPPEVFAASTPGAHRLGGRMPTFDSPIVQDRDISAALRHLDANLDTRTIKAADGAADEALIAVIALLTSRHSDFAVPETQSGSSGEPNFVRITREIIEDFYAEHERTSLGALAISAGVTPSHLVRVFSQSVGLSPHRYLVQTRVRRAAQFLASGVSASQVAAMTGFVDQSHLTTQFRRYMGTTPALYQRCVAPALSR